MNMIDEELDLAAILRKQECEDDFPLDFSCIQPDQDMLLLYTHLEPRAKAALRHALLHGKEDDILKILLTPTKPMSLYSKFKPVLVSATRRGLVGACSQLLLYLQTPKLLISQDELRLLTSHMLREAILFERVNVLECVIGSPLTLPYLTPEIMEPSLISIIKLDRHECWRCLWMTHAAKKKLLTGPVISTILKHIREFRRTVMFDELLQAFPSDSDIWESISLDSFMADTIKHTDMMLFYKCLQAPHLKTIEKSLDMAVSLRLHLIIDLLMNSRSKVMVIDAFKKIILSSIQDKKYNSIDTINLLFDHFVSRMSREESMDCPESSGEVSWRVAISD